MINVKKTLIFIIFLTASLCAHSQEQQQGAIGKIIRMIVNHNGVDEIYITTDDPNPNCQSLVLRPNNPNVSELSYNMIFSYLLAAKLADKTIELYTDQNCKLFRAEIKN